MPENSVELGWSARPIKEQQPVLSEEAAAQIDRDNHDLSRLRMRGLISDGEIRSIRKRLVKSIEEQIKKALNNA